MKRFNESDLKSIKKLLRKEFKGNSRIIYPGETVTIDYKFRMDNNTKKGIEINKLINKLTLQNIIE